MHLNVAKVKMLKIFLVLTERKTVHSEAAPGLGCELKIQETWHLAHQRSRCGKKLSLGCLLSSKITRSRHNVSKYSALLLLVCLNTQDANFSFPGDVFEKLTPLVVFCCLSEDLGCVGDLFGHTRAFNSMFYLLRTPKR